MDRVKSNCEENDCIFCQIVAGKAKSWKVYEDENAYAFLDIHPATEYHTLIVPKRHYESIFEIPAAELKELISAVKKVVDIYSSKLGLQNVQIINSSGREAQQDVFHIHFHVVPRKFGDGQDVQWTTHPEWQTKFDEQLKKIQ